jgi:signal peptidase
MAEGKARKKDVKAEEKDRGSLLSRFLKSENKAISVFRELLWVVAVVGGIALILLLASGTWPAVVTIESESMVPNMHVGDLVFVVTPDRFGPLQTWQEGQISGYQKFGNYGDVIIYNPNGVTGPTFLILGGQHPIIHRAIVYAQIGLNVTVPEARGTVTYSSPADGYLTKGDNNPQIDQKSVLSHYGRIQPVKKEWVVGKALFTIPLLGYLPLNIIPVSAVIIALLIIHELYLSRRGREVRPMKKKAGKR